VLKAGAIEAIARMKDCRTNLLLIDGSQMTVGMTAREIYELPRFYDKAGADRGGCYAVFHPPGAADREDFRFYENVCLNRGWIVKLFSDEQEAIAWLLTEGHD
jgi:hypothetical protein